MKVTYVSPLEEVNPENDNIDVHMELDDGRIYSFDVMTPNNVFWCMDNEGLDYFFGHPPLFVRRLTEDNVERAMKAVVSEDGGKWLDVYGVLQTTND